MKLSSPPPPPPTQLVLLFLLVLLFVVVVAVGDNTPAAEAAATLKLERRRVVEDISEMRKRDRVRHGRLLQQQSSSASLNVVDFTVQGTFNPYLVGLYYTKLQLGTPPKDYYVQIDTGSDVLWVSCASCSGCPVTSGLQIPLNFFDPGASSTASLISCSDHRCGFGVQSSDSGCSLDNNQCSYQFQYGDGSGTLGYYVSDVLHFDTVVGGSLVSNNMASVVFGCSTLQSGELKKSDRAVDGIFGFGQRGMSVISQLASQGVTSRVFSHCLRGDDVGGGILVFGEIVNPSIVYSPLVPSQSHYNLNLHSISVNGQTLAIDPSVFSTSSNQGTIVDSGTTLAYLTEPAYDVFVNAITSVSQNTQPIVEKGNRCFVVTSSVDDLFPQVSLNFAGGASMQLSPRQYLIKQDSIAGVATWCIGLQKSQGEGLTILGDLVLRDKIFVYDIGNQQIGWADYDCSTSVNVTASTTTGTSEYVKQLSNGSSQNVNPLKVIPFLLQISVLGCLFL